NDELNATDGVSSRHAPDARRSLDRKRELLVAHLGQKLVSVVGRLSNAFSADETHTPNEGVILAIHPLFEDIGEYPPRVADGPTLTLGGAAPRNIGKRLRNESCPLVHLLGLIEQTEFPGGPELGDDDAHVAVIVLVEQVEPLEVAVYCASDETPAVVAEEVEHAAVGVDVIEEALSGL